MKGMYNGVTMKLRYLYPYLSTKCLSLSKPAQLRLAWFDWYSGHNKNARLTCRHFGISPDTFYRWKKRFNTNNLKSLEDNKKNRRPHKLRNMSTSIEIIRTVILIRKNNLEMSKYEIKEELKRKNISLGTSSIQKIINRNPSLLNTQHIKKLKSRKKRHIARIKAGSELKDKYPGALVQVDTKHLYILGKRFYLFTAIDCKSRIGFVSVYLTGSSLSGAEFLKEMVTFSPFKIEAIQTDNGSEYLLNFHKKCEELGIKHFFTDPRCPKQNGRVERFIQTATYEFFNWQDDLVDEILMIKEKCLEFNLMYNTKRYHQALGYKTPFEYLEELKCSNLVKGKVYGI